MTRTRLLGLAFVFALLASPSAVQPPPEGAFGRTSEIPRIVAMTGDELRSVVLIRGVVEAAEHELQDGSANVGALTIAAPRNSVPLMLLKDLRGQTVEVVLRVVEPRKLEGISR